MRIILVAKLFSIINFINSNFTNPDGKNGALPKGVAIIVIQYTITGSIISVALCIVQFFLMKKDLG